MSGTRLLGRRDARYAVTLEGMSGTHVFGGHDARYTPTRRA
jgi:hypothetical protein